MKKRVTGVDVGLDDGVEWNPPKTARPKRFSVDAMLDYEAAKRESSPWYIRKETAKNVLFALGLGALILSIPSGIGLLSKQRFSGTVDNCMRDELPRVKSVLILTRNQIEKLRKCVGVPNEALFEALRDGKIEQECKEGGGSKQEVEDCKNTAFKSLKEKVGVED